MVEIWSAIPYNASLVDSVDMIVSPKHQKHVKNYLTCSGMNPEVIENNLQNAIEIENKIDDDSLLTRVSTGKNNRFKSLFYLYKKSKYFLYFFWKNNEIEFRNFLYIKRAKNHKEVYLVSVSRWK